MLIQEYGTAILTFTSDSPPARLGWRCPGCSRCYSPDLHACPTCGALPVVTLVFDCLPEAGTLGALSPEYASH